MFDTHMQCSAGFHGRTLTENGMRVDWLGRAAGEDHGGKTAGVGMGERWHRQGCAGHRVGFVPRGVACHDCFAREKELPEAK
jgi:hypothetical protein